MSLFLRRLEPFRELRDIENRLHQLSSKEGESNVAAFTPTVNTREGDYAYHIEVDLPGVKKEDIHVEVKENRLTISGERKVKEEVKEEDYHRVESSYGKFERSFTLPDNVDAENVDASTNDGVLEVVLPKKERGTSKKIEVK
ncbi:Spore protein SP21 [Hydrogenovibrio crunogenus]|uniref:Spore protein SP21 n=1 Tax=Hydrogenovibrio crunogenus TaxID=39765 RepID=A0A4P7P211_9GAMM|nr:Hsp20/alpha crystallin family protein [Hydrogenovibrio crunogenus]QBZ84066.1 Spore protein SP21 [Hydrogenovibrio crunogenus]RUM92036.1 MAG: Hsp20/alpha crystallin family protein [Thiomicrospira sp.]